MLSAAALNGMCGGRISVGSVLSCKHHHSETEKLLGYEVKDEAVNKHQSV